MAGFSGFTRAFMASLALGAAALPAEADASGQPENVRLGYEVYFSGLHILSVDAELETSDEKYRLKVSSATQGMTDFFVGWKGESETSGLFAGSRLFHKASGTGACGKVTRVLSKSTTAPLAT
jgi:hypothetical protein